MEHRDLDVYGPISNEVGRGPAACKQGYRVGPGRHLVGHDDGSSEFKLVGDVHREAGDYGAVGIVPDQVLGTPAIVAEGGA